MTRFFDGKRILSINMVDCKSGICFEDEFFDIQKRIYDEKRCAYMAKNVYWLALRAERYANKKIQKENAPWTLKSNRSPA